MTESVTVPNESILDSIKKPLGLTADYDVFDADIVMHINSVFTALHQLGIGPPEGFMIEDANATWDTFLRGDVLFNSVKTYIYLKVKLVFDPPGTSFVITSIEKQIAELEWRLNQHREGELWSRMQAEAAIQESTTPLEF